MKSNTIHTNIRFTCNCVVGDIYLAPGLPAVLHLRIIYFYSRVGLLFSVSDITDIL